MSHPETMLNVLRHCVKFLKNNNPKSCLLKRYTEHVRGCTHTLPPEGITMSTYHKCGSCKAAELPLACHAISLVVPTTSYTPSKFFFLCVLSHKIKPCFQASKKAADIQKHINI